MGLLLAAPTAAASIPNSLKSGCSTLTPHAGYSYRFCNDGLPPSGGTTPNQSGAAAVKVPAKYQATAGDDYTGLSGPSDDSDLMPGADNQGFVSLDVDISVPTIPAPAGGYPMLVFMHGCCAGDKTSWEATSFDAAGEKWHYNNAWFASRGYVVVNYTARGFVNGENGGNRGSTGETQLDSRRFEINDFQHLAGLVADDPFFGVNPQRVVVTGGSYGGGFSWLALTDPLWKSPAGTDMKLAAAAPKYGWTDLVDSLVPTGRHSQDPGDLPAFDGTDSTAPIGTPKRSIVTALYDSGKTGIPPGSPHTTFPSYIDEAIQCLTSGDPFESNPLCAGTLANTLPSFISDRSAYYQNQWFSKIASDPAYRIPLFSAATFTDPLFPPVEHRRMANRIQSTVPGYPVQQYYGDYQHFVQNKAKEWGDICGGDRHVCSFSDYAGGDVNATPAGLARTGATTRLNRFVDHYAQPPGNPSAPQPPFDVTASLQVCPQNAYGQPADEPGPTFSAASFGQLTSSVLHLDMAGTQVTVNDTSPNAHGANSDPVANSVANGGRCPVETTPAGPGVATYDSAPLPRQATMIGATKVSIDYSATTTLGDYQLNSRLYDVFPNGTAVMVDRGTRRVTAAGGTVTYELRGNGWRFLPGHRIRLEVAQDDDPHLKPSSVASSTTITGVDLDVPVREGHDVPVAASPLTVALVPAFRQTINSTQCSARGGLNSAHGAPLAFGSCNPPGYIPGTAARLGPQAVGSAQLTAVPGDLSTAADEADLAIALNVTDVRSISGGGDYAPSAGQDVAVVQKLRLTDAGNGDSQDEAGTVVDFDYALGANCATTPDPGTGSTCGVSTSADAVTPGAVKEGREMVLQVFRVRVNDSGTNGASGDADDRVFAQQGIFIP